MIPAPSMTCQELDHFIGPYLDGEFDADEGMDVDQHLARCGECARRVHAEKLFRENLRSTARKASKAAQAPESLRLAVASGLRRERRRAAAIRFAKLGAAAAAIAAATSSAYLYHQPDARHRYVEEAALRHAKGYPMEIQRLSAQETEGWFRDKLGVRVSVPELPRAALAGGRLLNVLEKPAAYISYDGEGSRGKVPGRIGVFVFHDGQKDAPFHTLPDADVASSHGYNVVSWRDRDVVYMLTSDLEESDILQMLGSTPRGTAERTSPGGRDLPVRAVSLER